MILCGELSTMNVVCLEKNYIHENTFCLSFVNMIDLEEFMKTLIVENSSSSCDLTVAIAESRFQVQFIDYLTKVKKSDFDTLCKCQEIYHSTKGGSVPSTVQRDTYYRLITEYKKFSLADLKQIARGTQIIDEDFYREFHWLERNVASDDVEQRKSQLFAKRFESRGKWFVKYLQEKSVVDDNLIKSIREMIHATERRPDDYTH